MQLQGAARCVWWRSWEVPLQGAAAKCLWQCGVRFGACDGATVGAAAMVLPAKSLVGQHAYLYDAGLWATQTSAAEINIRWRRR